MPFVRTSSNSNCPGRRRSRTILAKWAEMLASGKEKQAEVCRLTRDLADAEVELNDRVYRLFNLTPDEIELLQREVEH